MLYKLKTIVCIFNSICLSVSAPLSVTTSSHVKTVRSPRELYPLSQNVEVFYRSGLKHQQTVLRNWTLLFQVSILLPWLNHVYWFHNRCACMHVEDNSSHSKFLTYATCKKKRWPKPSIGHSSQCSRGHCIELMIAGFRALFQGCARIYTHSLVFILLETGSIPRGDNPSTTML